MSHQTRWSGTHNNVTRAPWRALVEHSIHWRCYTHHQCSAPFHEMLGRRAERNGIQFRTTKFHSFGDSAIRCSTASKLRNLRYITDRNLTVAAYRIRFADRKRRLTDLLPGDSHADGYYTGQSDAVGRATVAT